MSSFRGTREPEMRAVRHDSMRGSLQDLLDDGDVSAIAQAAYAGAYLFSRNRERNDDHLTAMACDAVAAGVQVIDEEFAAI
jgi:hypothetical protein